MAKKKDDKICGRVLRVIDGDTFEIKVTKQSKSNKYDYNPIEKIRTEKRSTPEQGERGSKKAKKELQRMLKNKEICIKVKARDKYGRLIGDHEKNF